ncbi:sensor histidine kinase [Siphonobacter sp. BAB-5405]|uniref:sensor histidine kinase n=1 Tax=Siphonobacter sp. BAB-5405 TaxID=1864825 RepID=UPI000C80B504|nr:HAMP domain-containing sensor histidine kinase [Siphonobacter sp. BAB-5405]PMD91444.1 sensor histidine kinase [Siphonobacter sp. BAB-5405]
MYREFYPDSNADVLIAGYQEVDRLKTETMLGSVREYDQQQQIAAASRANRLQYTLDQLQEMTRLRGDLLRTSSHDLKSSFGVVRSAAILLDQAEKPEEERTKLLQMLNRNLGNIHEMLQQLTDLSRLEAGYEVLDLQRFDASQLLNELVESAQPLATEKGLILRADGPPELLVSNDSVKIHRIVQNLLLNAIKYTQTGIVSVSWSKEGDFRWYISVQDSGPGLSDGLATLFSKQLMPKAEESGVLERDLSEVDEVPNFTSEELNHATSQGLPVSEGVGLLIVKRLCELLGGMMEIESIPNVGTLFRIRLQLDYKS